METGIELFWDERGRVRRLLCLWPILGIHAAEGG